jgi:hypothetical protein
MGDLYSTYSFIKCTARDALDDEENHRYEGFYVSTHVERKTPRPSRSTLSFVGIDSCLGWVRKMAWESKMAWVPKLGMIRKMIRKQRARRKQSRM